MPLQDIVIGARVRKDMGDIAGLAQDIKTRGLLQPIGVTQSGELIFGARRLEAARMLGLREIPVIIHDLNDLLGAERAENEQRKDFTPTEAVAIGRMIEEQRRPIAERERRERISAAKKGHPVQIDRMSNLRQNVARAVGVSGSSYFRAKAVVAAAESDPKQFGDLSEKMDATRNVSGVYCEMMRRKTGAAADPEFTGQRPKRTGVRTDKTAPYDPKSTGQLQRANGQKLRMINCLSTMRGAGTGLDTLDVPMAMSVCDADEIAVWRSEIKEIVRCLRQFETKLPRR